MYPQHTQTNLYSSYYHKLTATLAAPTFISYRQGTPSSPKDTAPSPNMSVELARPNTSIHYPLYTPHSLPMPIGQLRVDGWRNLTHDYPDRHVIAAILGICTFGVRIGYEALRNTATIHPNLSTATTDAQLVTADIVSELEKNRFILYPDRESLPTHYTASLLGLTDKSDGSKRRIHHLSYPAGNPEAINSGIPEHYGTIRFRGIEDAIRAVQELGRDCTLIKRDFESAFRHIPVSPIDAPLLGFHWQNQFYAESFLPFGLRTAPYVFNLFAEVFHWILEQQLQTQNISSRIIHYLDDFLIALPPGPNNRLNHSTQMFSTLCSEVGLSIKTAKNEEGTAVSFAGFILDTRSMVIRLPQKKLLKARQIVNKASACQSLTLLDIQKLTGYLNFVSTVVPLGKTFLRRLYNMELYFPPQAAKYHRRRISGEAKKDLKWWSNALMHPPERSIATRRREVIRCWTDAASTRGLGGFYLTHGQARPEQNAAFSIAIPQSLANGREHINTQEMRAVEQMLLYWGREWKGKSLLLHVDNRAVAHGISNMTIRGASMQVLRRCLLLTNEYDIDLEAKWISTNDNALADALSRLEYSKIADLAPQLVCPTGSLPQRGFLTYSNRDYPR